MSLDLRRLDFFREESRGACCGELFAEEPDGPALDITVLPVEAFVEVVPGRRRLELRCSRVTSGVSLEVALRLRAAGGAADGVAVV